jgi:hypothetical protein
VGKREKGDAVVEKRLARRRARLERRLEAAQERVARRTAKLAAASQAQGSRAAERVRRRADKLRRARETWAQVAARLANLPDPVPAADDGGTRTGVVGPTAETVAYCLRERARRSMHDPRPVVLAGGRSALAGTCTGCGSRLVRFGG